MNYTILQGDNRETLKTIPDNSIDAIVTDPPYGIDFLGKSWDANTGALETYQECLRVLKPGGHILAFSAARTYHHLAVTLEQAGFEIRDQIMWIYSSGFPKSQDVGRSIQRSIGVEEYEEMVDTTKNAGFGMTDHARVRAGEEWSTTQKQVGKVRVTDPEAKKWEGWGTALKPAHEPICLARKPMKLSIAKNCQEWSVGALNIDATRIATDEQLQGARASMQTGAPQFQNSVTDTTDAKVEWEQNPAGRFPSNVIGEITDYQKYFYCPKVSRRERHIGFDDDTTMNKQQWLDLVGGKWCNEDGSMGEASRDGAKMCWIPDKGKIFVHGLRHEVEEILKKQGRETEIPQVKGNNHPTVKPVELMKYLIKLITPPGGTVLDPFTGSGSTGMAAVELGHTFIGCELDPNYVEIARTRIEAWHHDTQSGTTFEDLFE